MTLPGNQAKLEAAEHWPTLAEEAGMTLIHLAIGVRLAHPAVTAAIIGPRTMEQLESQLGGGRCRVERDVLDQIDEIVPPGTNLNTLGPRLRPPVPDRPVPPPQVVGGYERRRATSRTRRCAGWVPAPPR